MKSWLLVTDIFSPDIGGPASFTDRLGHALTAHGCRVTVVCATPAKHHHQDQTRPFRVLRQNRRQKLRLVARLAWEMRRHERTLVNGLESLAARATTIARRRYWLKIVGDTVWETARNLGLTTLGIDEFQKHEPRHPRLDHLSRRRRRYLEASNLIITPSRYLRQLVGGWGVAAERLRVIPNGLCVADFAGNQPRHRQPGEPLRLIFCGRLTNWKGVDTLLWALPDLSDVTLEVVGDGPELPRLAALTHQHKLKPRVTFSGRLDSAATRERLRMAHVLVLDSQYEGFSHTLLEAAAAGLARIASRCGGNPEIIRDGETGRLIPPRDTSALRAAIRELRDNEALRFRLAAAAHAGHRLFDINETVRHLLRLA